MEPREGSPSSQHGGASGGSLDQQQWTNESGSESDLIAISNGQQHYYDSPPLGYLSALKTADDKQPPYGYTNDGDPTRNGYQLEPATATEMASFADQSLVTPTYDSANSVFEYYPNEPNHSAEADAYRPYEHYPQQPQPRSHLHQSPANGYARYAEVAGPDYYDHQRHYFEHQEDANDYQGGSAQEDHYGLARAEEAKPEEQPTITTTPSYYGADADAAVESCLYEPSADTGSSILVDARTEDYDHDREDGGDQPPGQHQWTSESSSEPELLAIHGHHYYEPQQMHYLAAPDKQPDHHHHQARELLVPAEPSVFAEPNLMTASFTSVSKYDTGGSLIEYYPSDPNYNEPNSYRPYTSHHTHNPTDGYHRFEVGPDYYGQQQASETAANGLHYFEQEEAKTYHLLKQSNQEEPGHYARTGDGKIEEQRANMTELQPSAGLNTAAAAKASYYGTDTDTIPQMPRVSRLYDPNTEINSSLFDELPPDEYRNEQAGDEEEEDEEEGEEEEAEDEDSLMSSSGSTSTCLARTSSNGNFRHRSRVISAATTIHHTAGQVKLARCSPETIERLKLFLQRRQQLRGQPPATNPTPFRSCCASTSQPAMATLRAHNIRPTAIDKNGPGTIRGQLEQPAPVTNLSSTNKTSYHRDRPIGDDGACAYSQRSSTSGHINPKASSLSSSPSSCNESTCDESSNPTSRASTITTFHHHPATTTTAAIMTENRQLRNRTIVINSSSSSPYSSDQPVNDANRDLKRQAIGYGLETRSSKRRRRQDSQDAAA